jgi:hypothetical protein
LPPRASPSHISRPVSRVLCGASRELTRDGHSSGTPVARRFKQPTRTAGSGHRSWNNAAACAVTPSTPSLCGFAPGGVYRAAGVAVSAVRSCRTISPLPRAAPRGAAAVCFLWHFPWGRPRRTLSGTACLWSPDFPLRPWGEAAVQPTDGEGMGCGEDGVKGRVAACQVAGEIHLRCPASIAEAELTKSWHAAPNAATSRRDPGPRACRPPLSRVLPSRIGGRRLARPGS